MRSRPTVIVVALLSLTALASPESGIANHVRDERLAAGQDLPWGFNDDWYDASDTAAIDAAAAIQPSAAVIGDGSTAGPEGYEAFVSAALSLVLDAAYPPPWGAAPGSCLEPGGKCRTPLPDLGSTARFHVNWSAVEKDPPDAATGDHAYDWTRIDAVYNAFLARGIVPVMELVNSPAWARVPGECSEPDGRCKFPPADEHMEDWRAFVQAAIERYRRILAVEVWNEPNLARFFAPAPDPSRYVEILRRAHAAAQAASSTKPVIVGGLAQPLPGRSVNFSAPDFLERVYGHPGARSSFEGIAIHPYPNGPPFVTAMWRRIEEIAGVRSDNGDDAATAPFWITEVGVSTKADDERAVIPQRQGEILVDLYNSTYGHQIEAFIISRFAAVPPTTFQTEMGVVEEGLAPKPAYCHLGRQIGSVPPSCAAP